MLESIGNPKFATLSIAIFSVLLFLLGVGRESLGSVCLRPNRVATQFQIYRIFTAPFFHGGLLHILFNTIAWMIIVRDYERTTGTIATLYAIFVLLIPFMAVLHSATAYLIDALAHTKFRFECAIGLSGILFAMLVANVELSGSSTVSVFGLFNMSARWYPWILALVLQLLSPNLSLLGHLSGIVMGYVLVFGYLQPITPSDSKLEDIENNLGLTRLPQWQPVPSSGVTAFLRNVLPDTNQSTGGSVFERMRGGFSGVTSWFSRSSGNHESQPFSGQGRALGGGESSVPAGRVPPTSRLLREAEEAKQAKAQSSQQQETKGEAQSQEGQSREQQPEQAGEGGTERS